MGVGCYPRKLAAQNTFDPDRFADLAWRVPIIGEVGLDVAYQVPLERLLMESDHGWSDPLGAIPHCVIWVEYLLSTLLKMDVREVRQLVWQNFSDVVHLTGTRDLLPQAMADLLP